MNIAGSRRRDDLFASATLPTQHCLEMVAESIPHIVWVTGPDGAPMFLNRLGAEFFGVSAHDSWSWLDLVHPDDSSRVRHAWTTAVAGRTGYEIDYRIRRVDGSYRWMKARSTALDGATGSAARWIGTLTDIDEEKQLQGALREAHARTAESLTLLQTLQSVAPVGFAFVDRDYRFVRINDMLAAINGRSVDEHLGRTVEEIAPHMWPHIEPIYRQVLETGEAAINVEATAPTAAINGMRDWLSSYYPVRVEDRIIGIGVVVVDITEHKRSEEFRTVVLDNMAEGLYVLDEDGLLTYMNNAASKMLGWTEEELLGAPMHESIHAERRDGTALAESDSELLKARTAGVAVRVSDDVFTRKDGTLVPVAYSAAPIRGAAKTSGVVVVFRDTTDEANDKAALQRELAALSWIGRIRDALDDGRFVLYEQPIIPIGDGTPSVELLLRMIDHDGHIVPPGTFLAVAEKYGLIGEIDQWVATQAIRLAATGRKVEVNVSAHSIGTSDYFDVIERELQATGADPTNIVFELTETALMSNLDAGEDFARRLAGLGCGLALDDFGTGFGSFTYLKRLPLQYLKIDIEFVRDLEANPCNPHVVNAIVSLARAFGLRTIAEGVEDVATMQLLREEGVDFAQGYALGRPQPVQW
jgi:PAS domain S-box-containing protein